MVTYNHESYIAQSIESVLAQKTDFGIELVIGEDRSHDRTYEIAVNFEHQNPEIVKVLRHGNNLGMLGNMFTTYAACSGEYVILLDADDYWTDPLKLQKQADFLDAHPDFIACAHDAMVTYENSDTPPHRFNRKKINSLLTTEDLIRDLSFQTATRLFRRIPLDSLPSWFQSTTAPDWALNVFLSLQGKIGYMDEIMSVYRVHHKGIYSGGESEKSIFKILSFLEALDQHFNFQYHSIIKERLARCHYDLVYFYQTERDWAKMRRHLAQAVRLSPASDYISWKARVKYLAVALCPAIYEWRKRDVGAGK